MQYLIILRLLKNYNGVEVMKNKKFIFSLIMLILIFNMLACSTARVSQSTNTDIIGHYIGQYTKLVGANSNDKSTNDLFYLDLNEDGTGISHRDNSDYTITTWQLIDGEFTMTEQMLNGDLIDYVGTLVDNKLTIYNGDPTNKWTYEYVYVYDTVEETEGTTN